MGRWHLAGGSSSAVMGVGLAIPVVVAHVEMRSPIGFAHGLLLAAGVLATGGVAALAAGFWQRCTLNMACWVARSASDVRPISCVWRAPAISVLRGSARKSYRFSLIIYGMLGVERHVAVVDFERHDGHRGHVEPPALLGPAAVKIPAT